MRRGFEKEQRIAIQTMWADKLGLIEYDEELTTKLLSLMHQSAVDYTRFFRELSSLPASIEPLKETFYREDTTHLDEQWQAWLGQWRDKVLQNQDADAVANKMKLSNPKYTWREWLVVPAYEQAMLGNYELVKELQLVLNDPYGEQTQEVEDKYYRQKPAAYFNAGGVSHYSCSS